MNHSLDEAVRTYSWNEMEHLCHALADKITASSFEPEVIIGIIRGGCFPALLLSHRFQIRELYTINVSTTVDDSVRAIRNVPIVHSISGLPSLSSRRVLLVDDVTNTGSTLRTAKHVIENLNPALLKIACPVWDTVAGSAQAQSMCIADFVVDEIHAWAKFPWEVS
jgi:uncharacterized protein